MEEKTTNRKRIAAKRRKETKENLDIQQQQQIIQQINIDILPEEVKLLIFSYLHFNYLLCRVQLVNKNFNQLIKKTIRIYKTKFIFKRNTLQQLFDEICKDFLSQLNNLQELYLPVNINSLKYLKYLENTKLNKLIFNRYHKELNINDLEPFFNKLNDLTLLYCMRFDDLQKFTQLTSVTDYSYHLDLLKNNNKITEYHSETTFATSNFTKYVNYLQNLTKLTITIYNCPRGEMMTMENNIVPLDVIGANLKNLIDLDLQTYYLPVHQLNYFNELINLKNLKLVYTRFTNINDEINDKRINLFEYLPNSLQSLNITHTNTTYEVKKRNIYGWQGIDKLINLKKLIFYLGIDLGEFNDYHLLSQLKNNLEEFKTDCCTINYELEFLKSIKELKKLKILSIEMSTWISNFPKDNNLNQIVNHLNSEMIQYLNLNISKITNLSFSNLVLLKNLKKLILTNVYYVTVDLSAILKQTNFPNLRKLALIKESNEREELESWRQGIYLKEEPFNVIQDKQERQLLNLVKNLPLLTGLTLKDWHGLTDKFISELCNNVRYLVSFKVNSSSLPKETVLKMVNTLVYLEKLYLGNCEKYKQEVQLLNPCIKVLNFKYN
ncbi:hypothetical protein ABK040_001861 [Willaertia magna]